MVFAVPATQQILDTERSQEVGAAESQDFMEELREIYPTLPEEAPLKVVGAPFSLRIFGDVYLVSAISVYYGDIRVAGIEITDGELSVGDTIHISGHTSNFTQSVYSIQIGHAAVQVARAGDSIGVKVTEHAREHDLVFKVTAS